MSDNHQCGECGTVHDGATCPKCGVSLTIKQVPRGGRPGVTVPVAFESDGEPHTEESCLRRRLAAAEKDRDEAKAACAAFKNGCIELTNKWPKIVREDDRVWLKLGDVGVILADGHGWLAAREESMRTALASLLGPLVRDNPGQAILDRLAAADSLLSRLAAIHGCAAAGVQAVEKRVHQLLFRRLVEGLATQTDRADRYAHLLLESDPEISQCRCDQCRKTWHELAEAGWFANIKAGDRWWEDDAPAVDVDASNYATYGNDSNEDASGATE